MAENPIWRFILQSENTASMTVMDPLLNTRERAEERARAEFIRNSYPQRVTRFSTYLTDLRINDTISINGVPWLVKSLVYDVDDKSIVTTVEVHRYG